MASGDFKTAYTRLQEITQIIKSTPVIDIEELMKLQEEAKLLYDFLQDSLHKYDNKSS